MEYKYAKYKSKYNKIKREYNRKINYIILGNIRDIKIDYIEELENGLKLLNGDVYEYKYKFVNNRFVLEDLSFENVSEDIKLYIEEKELKNNIIICIEESAPYGLFFVDRYPELCESIICYPFRLNTKESLERLEHKYIEKDGWKHISKKYEAINYFFEINNERLNELFDRNEDEEKKIINLLINLELRKQYKKIPKKYKKKTYLFTRLDMDSISVIKENFERKAIAEMKGILSPDDAIYTSMMWNIARIQYDKELMELNKENNNLKIHYMIGFEKNEDIGLITDAVKILTYK
jgi:hypothetical protein